MTNILHFKNFHNHRTISKTGNVIENEKNFSLKNKNDYIYKYYYLSFYLDARCMLDE